MPAAKLFLNLSQLLTGVDDLDSELSERYRALLNVKFGVAFVDELLRLYAGVLQDANPLASLMEKINATHDQRALAAARQIVKLWYFSNFNDPEKNGALANAGEPGKGIAWGLLKANAPGFSPGPYGYWAAKP
jgi:Membrane bound FAD containing D-sorbitol dehydrogenase